MDRSANLSDSDTSDTTIIDADKINIRKSLRKRKATFNNKNYEPAAVSSNSVHIPFKYLKEAALALSAPIVSVANERRDRCKKGRYNNYVHRHINHHCSLIKNAMMKNNWRPVCKLLISYINEKKVEREHQGVILKYTLLYLLNDPIAQKNDYLKRYLQLGLSCHSAEERDTLMKMLSSLPLNMSNNTKNE